MSSYELKIIIEAETAELITEILENHHAEAISFSDAEDQPIYEPELNKLQLWHKTQITALFHEFSELKDTLEILKNSLKNLNFSIQELQNQNWVEITQANFRPKKFGTRLWVCPPWEIIKPTRNEKVLLINPGLGFGTGSHPTTQLCLEWLDSHISSQQIVIDYGCGSGILALAAIKLGAKKVYAIDYDEQALEATNNNAQLNNISAASLNICLPKALTIIKADILIANILLQPLLDLANKFTDLIKENGEIALSGILKTQVDEIVNMYSQWFELEIKYEKEWALVFGKKINIE